MTSMVYRDFDRFSDAIRGIAGRFIPTARPTAAWRIEDLRLGHSSVQELQMGGATTFAGDGEAGTLTILVPLTDPRGVRVDGHRLDPDTFLLCRFERPFTFTQSDVSRWATITVPADLAEVLIPDEHLCRRVDRDELARLRALVRRTLDQGDTLGANPTRRSEAESEIALTFAQAVGRSEGLPADRHTGRKQISRSSVVARALALLKTAEHVPLQIEDLCRATWVAERTLRAIFQEYFGVGPIRLFKAYQLREIRAVLLRTHARCDSVASIAIRFGFENFSLLSRSYRELFGESPSTTLRAPPSKPLSSSVSWLQYATRIFVDNAS